MGDPDSGDEPMEEATERSGVWQRVPQSLRLGGAVVVPGKPRKLMEHDGLSWRIPRAQWSEQVQRLRPKAFLVRIDPLQEGGHNAVRLGYG